MTETQTLRCDFCSSTDVRFAEEAADADVGMVGVLQGEIHDTGITAHSAGDWAACADCHQLIQDDKRESLVRRAAASLAEREPDTKRLIAQGQLHYRDLNAMVRRMHAVFWANRTGTFRLVNH